MAGRKCRLCFIATRCAFDPGDAPGLHVDADPLRAGDFNFGREVDRLGEHAVRLHVPEHHAADDQVRQERILFVDGRFEIIRTHRDDLAQRVGPPLVVDGESLDRHVAAVFERDRLHPSIREQGGACRLDGEVLRAVEIEAPNVGVIRSEDRFLRIRAELSGHRLVHQPHGRFVP